MHSQVPMEWQPVITKRKVVNEADHLFRSQRFNVVKSLLEDRFKQPRWAKAQRK